MKKIAITGAAGQIGYSLLFALAKGLIWGENTSFSLHLLETEEGIKGLEGVMMELQDMASPLLVNIEYGTEAEKIFEGVDIAVLIGAKPRALGQERKDLLKENSKIFQSQGEALSCSAKKETKVLVVGNPCNTNAWVAKNAAKNISPKNFFAMTRLDQNRAVFQLAHKAKVPVSQVKEMFVWGNHSTTLVPDYLNAKIGGLPVSEVISDKEWLEKDFIEAVQKRGAEVIAKRGKSSALSAANAILSTLQNIEGTNSEKIFSLGLLSDGNPYGIAEDLIFSFPCQRNEEGEIEITKGIPLNPLMREALKKTENELKEEKLNSSAK